MMFRYSFGALCTLPFLPLMYLQGKRIKASVPRLPEATEPSGVVGEGHIPFRLLCIGESTVAGVGVARHSEGFSGTLARHLAEGLDKKIHWNVYARSGYTAQKVAERLVPKIAETQADLIVVGLGGNNAFALHSPRRWQQEIQNLIDALREKFPNTPITFTNMPPIKEFPAFSALIKWTVGNLVELLGEALSSQIQTQKNIYYSSEIITLAAWSKRLNVQAEAAHYFSDGVHPSKFTYQVWARDFAVFLLKNGSLTNPVI